MLYPLLLLPLLAELEGLLASGHNSQSSFPQVVSPEKIEDGTSSDEQISYVIPINKKRYTVHLQKRYFLADHFMVYLYNQGSMRSHSSDIPDQCYYEGHIKGYPNSVATLSTCSGLRGILQFENVSYGIEPLEASSTLQHIVYKLGNRENELTIFDKNRRNLEMPKNYDIFVNKNHRHGHTPVIEIICLSSEKSLHTLRNEGNLFTEMPGQLLLMLNQPESSLRSSFPLYLEMTVVVDKTLYDYLGFDSMIVTNKIIEIISLMNSVFTQLNVTIVLSSLELWSDKNKISTVGEADELLRRFLEWKQSYLTLRPHDVAYLFIYNEYPNYMGATYPGKMCTAQYSAGITMYPKNMTLETFSVIVTQMLGLSLGISYDDPAKCHCSESICVMNPRAMQNTGMKTFSNCSLSDFEHFKSTIGAKCLQNKPQMQRSPRPVCGNGVVEGDETCDCGSEEQCNPDNCCERTTCVLKQGSVCDSKSPSQTCCRGCQFLPDTHECRPPNHPVCDISEFCNGSSGQCPPDITIHDGHTCRDGGFICYKGTCPDLDKRCEEIYGKGSRNAPFSCYEEIQGQTDRFGNCGKDRQNRYIFCGWRNLICGRLICTYPSRVPYYPPNNSTASVIYAFVRDEVCITVDFGSSVKDDPLRIASGTVCDLDRICLHGVCKEARFLKSKSQTCATKCNGNGVCNSLGECNCTGGYLLPNCETRARSSLWSDKNGLIMEGASRNAERMWLLSLYIVLVILTSTTLVVTAWKAFKQWLFKEEESLCSESKSEGNTHSYVSRSKSQASSATPASSY